MGGGQFSLHTPLSLKWRQAWRADEGGHTLLEKWQKTVRQHTEITMKITKSDKCVCMCLWFTRQSESFGPVHPAAHCMWQQSLGRGPLHRWQPDAHLTRVTLDKNDKSRLSAVLHLLWTFSSENQIVSYSTHDVNSQVWQSCAVSPQQLFPHTEEQFGPVPEETITNKESWARIPQFLQLCKRLYGAVHEMPVCLCIRIACGIVK